MTDKKRQHLRKLAAELLQHYKERLDFYEGLNFDAATQKDALDHVLAIEFKYSNIERTKYEIEKLKQFDADYLKP